MKKSMLLVMVALFAVSAHAQEDQGSKSLTLWVDGSSGHMTQNPYYESDKMNGRMFSGNCVEYGVTFAHGFSNGFNYGVDIFAGNTLKFNYDDNVETDEEGKVTGYSATPTSISSWDWGYYPRVRMKVGYGIAGFSTYARLDSRLRLDVGASYTASFGSAGGVTVGTALCVFLVPTGYLAVYEGNGKYAEDTRHNMVDSFEVYANYAVPFAEKWSFRTQVRAMFTEGDRFSTKVTDDDGDVLYPGTQNFGQSFRLRWENRISYNALDNVSFYGQVRYQVDGLGLDSDAKAMLSPTGESDGYKADHQVFLQAGMSYKFDM